MTKQETIKYLQQLYPNGGHCWLDEQRIGAIGIAINALQEEPVSEDLEKAAEQYAYDTAPSIGVLNTVIEEAFKAGANWQREQMMKDAVEARVSFGQPVLLARPIPTSLAKDGDGVKLIIIKEG